MSPSPPPIYHNQFKSTQHSINDANLISDNRAIESLNFRNFKNPEAQRKSTKLNSGLVWAFGRNKDGELGLGNMKDALTPQSVSGFESARSVSSGQHHTVVVTKMGDIYSCGSSLHGKLGLPSSGIINIQKFTQIKLPIKAKQVACGDYHTLCLTEFGKVYAWGGSLHKKTADASTGVDKNEPRIVQSLSHVTIT